MIKKLTQLTLTLALILGCSSPLLIAGTTTAANSAADAACNGINAVSGDSATGCSDKATNTSTVQSTVKDIVRIFSWLVGIVSVFMVMLGGFYYVTSAGDATKAAKGRTTILYAIIGLVIVALAQVIVRFTIDTVVQ